MDEASVSVVIPCYKCAEVISRAVESVANQTVRPREVILVDDGSKDNTLSVLEQLGKLHGGDWIKIIALKENCGVSVARNAGWDSSTSHYVAFLDADDAWHPQKIEIQYTWMCAHPEVVLCGHRSVVVGLKSRPVLEELSLPPSVVLLSKIRILLSNPFVTPSFMLQRACPYRFDFTRRHTEDFLLVLEVAMDGNLVARIGAELALIFREPGKTGASSRIWEMRLGDLLNYRTLWLTRRISFAGISVLVLFSLFKFVFMLAVGPKRQVAVKSWLERRYR